MFCNFLALHSRSRVGRLLCQPKRRNTSFFGPQSFSLLENNLVGSPESVISLCYLSSTLAKRVKTPPQGGGSKKSSASDYCSQQQRWFSSSTLFAPERESWKHKPLKEWTERDVDDWLQSNKKFKVLSEKKIFESYTGDTLLKTTEEKIRELIDKHVLNLKTLEPNRLDLVEPLFNAIQDLKQDAHKTPVERLDPTVRKSLQEFERWSHLQASNLNNLKVGDIIELPDLGERPKELGGEGGKPLQKVLLTQQRLDHIREVVNELKFGQEEFSGEPSERGRILSGPNGIGKTVLSYLTAAVAWANGAIVLYIPNASLWTKVAIIEKEGVVQFDEPEAALYVLQKLLHLNAEKLAILPCQTEGNEGLTLLDLVNRGLSIPQNASKVLDKQIYPELQALTKRPVLCVVDEHQWIHKRNLQNKAFFTAYLTKDGAWKGLRTFVTLSGSAHSPFEFNLQPGMESWLYYLQPLTLEEFEKITGPDGPYELAEEYRTPEVLRITGGIPREIKRLKEFLEMGESLRSFVEFSTERFRTALLVWVAKIGVRSETEYLKFLEGMFNPLTRRDQVTGPGRQLLDTGLIYKKMPGGVYQATCLPSHRALLKYYYSNCYKNEDSPKDLPRNLEGLQPKPRAAKFEEYVGYVLYNGVNFTAFRLEQQDDKYQAVDITVRVPQMGQRLEFNEKVVPPNHGSDSSVPTLYVPSKDNFPAWDFVCHTPKILDSAQGKDRLIFIQTSLVDLAFHNSKYPGAFRASIEKGLVAKIITGITGTPCKAFITEDGFMKVVQLKEPNGSVSEDNTLDVQFVFVCGKVKREILENEERSRKKGQDYQTLQNLLMVSKEECEDSFQILFSYKDTK